MRDYYVSSDSEQLTRLYAVIAPINTKLENDDTEKHCSFSNILS